MQISRSELIILKHSNLDKRNKLDLLSINIQFTNGGDKPIQNIQIESAVLNNKIFSQLTVPWRVDDIQPSPHGLPNSDPIVGFSFSLSDLPSDNKNKLTINGNYFLNNKKDNFSYELDVDITSARQIIKDEFLLDANIYFDKNFDNEWTYKIVNNEFSYTGYQINGFQLRLNSPFTIVTSPQGWLVETDNVSFVVWHATLGYEIQTGASIDKFAIKTNSNKATGIIYTITSENQTLKKFGPIKFGTVLGPSL